MDSINDIKEEKKNGEVAGKQKRVKKKDTNTEQYPRGK